MTDSVFDEKRTGDFDTHGEIESAYGENAYGDFSSRRESEISDNFGIRGDQINLSEQRETDERALGNAELGGGDDAIMKYLVEAVSNDLPGIGRESEKEGHVQMAKCRDESERNQEEKKILTPLSIM